MAITMQRFSQKPMVAADPNYKMPEIGVGDPVLWYPDGDDKQQPFYGDVMKVGNGTIEIMTRDFTPEWKQSVRHITDPRMANQQMKVWGGWDYTPQWLKIKQLSERLEVALDGENLIRMVETHKEEMEEYKKHVASKIKGLELKVGRLSKGRPTEEYVDAEVDPGETEES